MYIGAQSGGFYALNEATGRWLWSRQLDTEPAATCPARGITSTAAVLPDPVTGTSTVYVSGARYLYALNAATGAVAWKTEIGPSAKAQPGRVLQLVVPDRGRAAHLRGPGIEL